MREIVPKQTFPHWLPMLARCLLVPVALGFVASTLFAQAPSPASTERAEEKQFPVAAAKASNEQRYQAWCRALSASPRRRTAYELLQEAGKDAVPVLIEYYDDASTNEIGRHLILLLLAQVPGEDSLEHALAVLSRPDESARSHALARLVLRKQDPEVLQGALREAFAAARREEQRFTLRQLYRVLGQLTVVNALAVLDEFVPPEGGGEAADEDGQWASLERELWRTALLRAGVRSPVAAYRALAEKRREHPRAVAPLMAGLDAFRHASSEMRHVSDRRHRVRIRAERAVIQLCREHPLMANVLLTHVDYRVRRLAVERLADRHTIGAVVFAFEALDDADRGIANQALETLTRFGPAAPELLEVLRETVPEETRRHLQGLAEAFPSAEELAELRAKREELRELLVPMIQQRTLHDPAAGELYRAWSEVQRHWQRLSVTWSRWWQENGDAFRPAPYRQLVHALREDLR